MWRYGMKHKGFSMTLPVNGLRGMEEPVGVYYHVLVYDRPLMDNECAEHDLVFLGECDG